MAGSAEGLEEEAASGEVSFFSYFGSEGFMELGDALFLGVIGLTDVAPDLGEAGGEFLVAERDDLAGVVGGEIGGGDFFGGDLSEEGVSPSGAGGESGDYAGTIGTAEFAVGLCEVLADGGVLEEGEALEGGATEGGSGEELFAGLAEVIGAGVDEGLEGASAGGEGGLFVKDEGSK